MNSLSQALRSARPKRPSATTGTWPVYSATCSINSCAVQSHNDSPNNQLLNPEAKNSPIHYDSPAPPPSSRRSWALLDDNAHLAFQSLIQDTRFISLRLLSGGSRAQPLQPVHTAPWTLKKRAWAGAGLFQEHTAQAENGENCACGSPRFACHERPFGMHARGCRLMPVTIGRVRAFTSTARLLSALTRADQRF